MKVREFWNLVKTVLRDNWVEILIAIIGALVLIFCKVPARVLIV